MIRRSERKRRRPSFFMSQSQPGSKEKKYARKGSSPSEAKKSHQRPQQHQHQQCKFEDLPPEVLEMVLQFLPYKDIAGPIRLMSKKCAAVSTVILNRAFLLGGPRIRETLSQIDDFSRNDKNDRYRAIYARAYNCLEIVQTQYELLTACCWRYTHPTAERSFGRLCFYGGAILDELDRMLKDAINDPTSLVNVYETSKRITDFSFMCKTFMNYFEKVSERKVNKNSLISGCKAVDILDCLLTTREVLNCKLSGKKNNPNIRTVNMKVRYVFQRAWFTCLEVPDHRKNRPQDSWREQQRYMYLRLRRLVGIINENYLEKKHYDRDLVYTHELIPPPSQLSCSSYSGYGECGGKFYYYGNLNEYAYEAKVLDTWRKNVARDRAEKKIAEDKPCYDLVIKVELKCSSELAPSSIRKLLRCDNDYEDTVVSRPYLYLKLIVSCPASVSNKLPGQCVWELRNPRQLKFH